MHFGSVWLMCDNICTPHCEFGACSLGASHAKLLGTMLQESGTTATVAALVGWTVVVGNVGDSLAFLDTGSEVVQVGSPRPQIRAVTC